MASALLWAAGAYSPAVAASPYGVWVDHTGRGAVEVKQCGATLCGVVVWARTAADARRGCGRKLFGGLKQVGLNSWDNGWIVAPDSGDKYDVAIKPLDRNRLEVLGYAGTKLFSKSMVFKRAPSNLKRCDEDLRKPATDVIAKAETDRPRPPSGVGAPNVPLIPEAALKQRPRATDTARRVPPPRNLMPATAAHQPAIAGPAGAADLAPRIVFYTPPKWAPTPARHPGSGSIMARLALETSQLPLGQPRSTFVTPPNDNFDPIVPPRPQLAMRPAPLSVGGPSEMAGLDPNARFAKNARPGSDLASCEVRAPFVVSAIPCRR